MRKKSENGTTVSADLIVNSPPFVVFPIMFVMWLFVLVKRVIDALFEDLIRVLWSIWTP